MSCRHSTERAPVCNWRGMSEVNTRVIFYFIEIRLYVARRRRRREREEEENYHKSDGVRAINPRRSHAAEDYNTGIALFYMEIPVLRVYLSGRAPDDSVMQHSAAAVVLYVYKYIIFPALLETNYYVRI